MLIVLWLIAIVLLVAVRLTKKKHNKISRGLYFLVIAFILGPIFLPGWIFGKWNVVKSLGEKPVSYIMFTPSEPGWEVNLTDTPVKVVNKEQVDHILSSLQHIEHYSPSHPMRIWETKMVLFTNSHDSLVLEVNRTENNGTLIYTPGNSFRKDELGQYLEQITNFKRPQKAK